MFATRIGDMHVCPLVTPGVPPIPHVGGPVLPPGVPQVLIGKVPANVAGNTCVCVGPPDVCLPGQFQVLVQNRPLIRTLVDSTAHGGRVVVGCFQVIVGSGGASAVCSAMEAGSMNVSLPSMPAPPSQAELDQINADIADAGDALNENISDKEAELAFLENNGGTQAQIDAVQAELDELNGF